MCHFCGKSPKVSWIGSLLSPSARNLSQMWIKIKALLEQFKHSEICCFGALIWRFVSEVLVWVTSLKYYCMGGKKPNKPWRCITWFEIFFSLASVLLLTQNNHVPTFGCEDKHSFRSLVDCLTAVIIIKYVDAACTMGSKFQLSLSLSCILTAEFSFPNWKCSQFSVVGIKHSKHTSCFHTVGQW